MIMECGDIPRCVYCLNRYSRECEEDVKQAKQWYSRWMQDGSEAGPLVDDCTKFKLDRMERNKLDKVI
jgi:uncharacterized protein (DUF305 family)